MSVLFVNKKSADFLDIIWKKETRVAKNNGARFKFERFKGMETILKFA